MHNKYPECVNVSDVHLLTDSSPAEFVATIVFGNHELPTAVGIVEIGVRSGRLKLELKNGRIPPQKMQLTANLEKQVRVKAKIEHQEKNKLEKKHAQGTDAALGASSSSATLTLKMSDEDSTAHVQEAGSGKTYEVEQTLCQVRAQGSPESPVWFFHAQGIHPYLTGSLIAEKFGEVTWNADRIHQYQVHFDVYPKDLHLKIDYSGLGALAPRSLAESIIKAMIIRHVRHGKAARLSSSENPNG